RPDRLVGGALVVVEAPDELWIDDVRDAEARHPFAQAVEVRAAVVAEELLHLRRADGDLLAERVLAIENADGVRLRALLAVLAQAIGFTAQILLQRGPVRGAAAGVAERVHVHLERHPERAQPTVEHLDLLGVDARSRR